MATKKLRADAPLIAQINTITPASVAIGNTFTVTINGKSITFTATATTVANVTAGLAALLAASTIPEFAEITWADITTAVTATCKTPGKMFTQTSSATGGTASLTTATATANSGPNDIGLAGNYSSSGLPSSTDTLIVEEGAADLLYSLDQHTIVLAELDAKGSFEGNAGLPIYNTDGTPYLEYRSTFLAYGATVLNIGEGPGSGPARWQHDTGTGASAITVYASGGNQDNGLPAVLFKGSNASNTLTILGGTVGTAMIGTDTAQYATIYITGGSLICGVGTTLATLEIDDNPTVTLLCAATTINMSGSATLTMQGVGAIGTINQYGGSITCDSTGTISTLVLWPAAKIDFSGIATPITVTNCTAYEGSVLIDPHKRVQFTNPVAMKGDAAAILANWQIGSNRNITIA